MRLIRIFILGTLIFLSSFLNAGISNTKHNLSVTSAGTVKAVSETEICVFCHIPHQAQAVGKPLWNRSMPTSNYTMYDSNHLRRMGYPEMETDLGSANDTPGALSRQCLSCHDGTVAVGSVSKLRGRDATITMSGVAGDGTILPADGGYIGTDLSYHHPIGVIYDSTIVKNFNIGTRSAELVATPALPIKLYEYQGYAGKYVECSSCHNPHKEAKNANGGSNRFLHISTNDTLAENMVDMCKSCHVKRPSGGSPNPHETVVFSYSDSAVVDKYGVNSVAELFCINCHTPHNAASGQPYLQRKIEQNTCFMGASGDRTAAPCHGTGTLSSNVDIESIIDRQYSHRSIKDIDGVHTNLDVLYGTDVAKYPVGSKGLTFSDSQHVECVDCHNPHRVSSSNHVPDDQMYPTIPTNDVSPVLEGVSGVEPTWPTEWTQPTVFATMAESEKEYQICFKCHSYWGLGTSIAPNNPASVYPSVSDPLNVPLTDVAWELNKENKSGHPVVFPNSAAGRPGSYSPQALSAVQMVSPWTNVGNTTMYCSDCHGADNELNVVDPKGPHGSNQKFMLKGDNNNYYWPTKSDGITLYDTDDIGTVGDSGNFCKNCHNLMEPHKNQWNATMRNKNYSCVTCHVAVPHGSPVSRLIGYDNFPEPYNYLGNSLKITGFKKNALTDINTNDISGTNCGGGMCHGGMGWTGVPDPDISPFP
ncbi:MAG: cytochrome c3 family protein [Sulfurimonas sp.]|nr:cytochrome c3 family protein [Sulfurimonas sp.]